MTHKSENPSEPNPNPPRRADDPNFSPPRSAKDPVYGPPRTVHEPAAYSSPRHTLHSVSAHDTAELGIPFSKRVSWGAIFAGVLTVLALQLAFSLLGIGIGAAAVNPIADAQPFSGIGMGAAIWWIVTMLISLFAGGWVAARLAAMPEPAEAMLHGFTVWTVSTIATVMLLTTAVGQIIGGAFNVVGQGIQMAGAAVVGTEGVAAQRGPDGRTETLQGALIEIQQSLTGPESQQAQQELSLIIQRLMQEPAGSPAVRQQAVDYLVRYGEMQPQRARQIVDDALQTYEQDGQRMMSQAEQQAREVGDEVSTALAHAGIWSFVALLLGAMAASFGGRFGTPRNLTADTRLGDSTDINR
jgi:polyhydroxyalkanoate synthesis regulator phasin